MKFKAGDRVHVLRLNTNEVDFCGTLKNVGKRAANIIDCTDEKYNYIAVYLPNHESFGLNEQDYYVLAEDEENKRTINDLDTSAYETKLVTEDEEDTKGGNNMPTIKRKVEMNLPQLIEWGWENGIEKRSFKSNDGKVIANFEDMDNFITDNFVSSDVTFTVEIEEEITEDTKLYLVERYISSYEDFKLKYKSHPNRSIKSILEHRQPHLKTTHFYTEVNNELILIWKNGKLVE